MSDTSESGASAHSSRTATEQRGYQQLREAGITADNARRIARQASEQAHTRLERDRK
jgi:histone H3/H4